MQSCIVMQSALKAIDFHEHQVMEIARRKVAEQQRADGDKLAMLSRQLDSLHSENSGLQRECSDLRSRLSQRLAQDQAASERQQASLSNSLVRQQDDEFNRNKHINHAPAASISPRREPRSPGLSLGSFGHASPLRPRSQDRPPQHHNESAAGPILPSGNYSLRAYYSPELT
jgi:regulator of replication initiation timing